MFVEEKKPIATQIKSNQIQVELIHACLYSDRVIDRHIPPLWQGLPVTSKQTCKRISQKGSQNCNFAWQLLWHVFTKWLISKETNEVVETDSSSSLTLNS